MDHDEQALRHRGCTRLNVGAQGEPKKKCEFHDLLLQLCGDVQKMISKWGVCGGLHFWVEFKLKNLEGINFGRLKFLVSFPCFSI
jgi:hypothetical protein